MMLAWRLIGWGATIIVGSAVIAILAYIVLCVIALGMGVYAALA